MAVYAALAAALFEETGRLLAMKGLTKAVAGNGTPVAYGIGHAGAECVFIAVNIGIIAVIGYLIATGQAQSLNLSADTTKAITDSLTGATLVTSLFGGLERVVAFVFQVAFSLLVWHAVSARRIGFYWLAVAFHFLVDFPAGLAQQKLLPLTIAEIEAGYALLAVIVLAGMWAFARPKAAAGEPAA